MSVGLMGLILLLTQQIKNQDWMRRKNFNNFITMAQTNDKMTNNTILLLENIANLSFCGHSSTIINVLDKSGFYVHLF